MNPYDQAHRLAKALKNSSQYQDYRRARGKVVNNPRVLEMIKDLHQKQFALQSKALMGKELTEEEKSRLNKLQEIVLMHDTAREYLEAEHQMIVLLADIQKIIGEAVEVGLPEDDEKDEDVKDSQEEREDEDT